MITSSKRTIVLGWACRRDLIWSNNTTAKEVVYAAAIRPRKAAGDDVDLAIDFHGAISPALAKVLIKALEPYFPMFIEEPVNCQNHDVMAEIARGTHLPIAKATGRR